jgi:hypothetical protein
MSKKIKKKINVSYARYLKNRLADKHIKPGDQSKAELHSKRVNFIKRFFIKLIIISLLLVLFLPLINKNWGGFKLNLQKKESQEESAESNTDLENYEDIKSGSNSSSDKDMPVMDNPQFYGNDDNTQPYNITADTGISVSERKIVLVNIGGKITLQNNSQIKVKADQGDYFVKDREVSLNGGVKINFNDEYLLSTDSAYIKLKENMATGSEKVTIDGSIGDIIANGFNIRNSGEEILFFGGVEMISNSGE